jgi:hypothetical protein
MHADGDAAGARREVIAGEGALMFFVEPPRGVEGERMRRDDLAGEEMGEKVHG